MSNKLYTYVGGMEIDFECHILEGSTISIDVEDDEKGNFVGIAMTDGYKCTYSTRIHDPVVKYILLAKTLIGHNLKSDIHKLEKWTGLILSRNMGDDTMIMSYCVNPTKESHGLKALGQERGYNWPTYKEMTHPNGCHKKVTLDKIPTEEVARYCCTDAYVAYLLWKEFKQKMKYDQRRIYYTLEKPMNHLLYEMENKGITTDIQELSSLNAEFNSEIMQIKNHYPEINLNSPKQVVGKLFPLLGIDEESSGKEILMKYADKPEIKDLLDYREYSKLSSTYTQPLMATPNQRVHTTFNQVSVNEVEDTYKGIRTGRLSSSEPNLHNIPTRTENGHKLRKCFIAKPGYILLCFDYSQIEYRLLAHFTKEPILIDAYMNDRDIHKETARILGLGEDDKARYLGKTLNFAAIYGAQAKKIAQTINNANIGIKITEKEAQEFLNRYWKKLPRVDEWICQTKISAHKLKSITTIGGRRIPLPLINSPDYYEMLHWERAAVNYSIQGSAADIIKLAMLELRSKYALVTNLQVHDELIHECLDTPNNAEIYMSCIKHTMENIIKLDVPLKVSSGKGRSWADAK